MFVAVKAVGTGQVGGAVDTIVGEDIQNPHPHVEDAS